MVMVIHLTDGLVLSSSRSARWSLARLGFGSCLLVGWVVDAQLLAKWTDPTGQTGQTLRPMAKVSKAEKIQWSSEEVGLPGIRQSEELDGKLGWIPLGIM